MTKLMLEAIEALRQLPDEQQDDIAGIVLRLAGGTSGQSLSVNDIRHSIEASREAAGVVAAEDVFDRLEAKLKGSTIQGWPRVDASSRCLPSPTSHRGLHRRLQSQCGAATRP